jgi:hypothetical protein
MNYYIDNSLPMILLRNNLGDKKIEFPRDSKAILRLEDTVLEGIKLNLESYPSQRFITVKGCESSTVKREDIQGKVKRAKHKL